MGTTANRNLPFPEDTDTVGQGDDAIKALAIAVDTELIKVIPVSGGGTAATTTLAAKTNLGITIGQVDPSGGAEGDIYFKVV